MSDPVIIGNATRIYALCEFPSQEPRYVGKTIQPLRLRMAAHMRTARSPRLPVGYWLAKRIREGRQVCIKWLETVDAGHDWADRERHWIAEHRSIGARLLNLTDGGEGLAGHRFTEQHKQRIAAALRTGGEFACAICGAKFWRKQCEIKKGNAKFCSHSCYQASLRGVTRPVPALTTARGVAAAAALRKARTHCKRGHSLSGENLFITTQGSRGCKECRKLHKEAYRARRS